MPAEQPCNREVVLPNSSKPMARWRDGAPPAGDRGRKKTRDDTRGTTVPLRLDTDTELRMACGSLLAKVRQ
ncbi:hypothetical protein E8E11_001170 [Didymella keratinophila]|nr:hypothetical protein E8E11_001170 [Didymella keratinophila]